MFVDAGFTINLDRALHVKVSLVKFRDINEALASGHRIAKRHTPVSLAVDRLHHYSLFVPDAQLALK